MFNLSQQMVSTKNGKLVTVKYSGQNDKNRIFFLHGFGMHKAEASYLYSTIAKQLNDNTCILFDYFGCGDSPGDLTNVSFSSMYNDARDLLSFFSKSNQCLDTILVAKGLSVPIALELSKLDEKIKKLVLIGGDQSWIFPDIDLKEQILARWQLEGIIEIRSLLKSAIDETEKKYLMYWFFNLGLNVHEFRAEKISYDLLTQVERISICDMISASSKDILWFSQKNLLNSMISGGNKSEFVDISEEDNFFHYFLPQNIDKITKIIKDFIK